jgi:hypothetical protein
VSNLDLTSYITAPKEGNTPVTAAFTDPQYTAAEVRWDPNHSPFKGGYSYTATVVLIAGPGYAFAKANNFHHQGALSVKSKNNTGLSVTVEVFFPADTVNVKVDGGY